MAFLVRVIAVQADRPAATQQYLFDVSPLNATNQLTLYFSDVGGGFLANLNLAIQTQMLQYADKLRDTGGDHPSARTSGS